MESTQDGLDEMIDKFHEHFSESKDNSFISYLKDNLMNHMFEPKNYELISVGYIAMPNNTQRGIRLFAQESKDVGPRELLKVINQYEKEGKLLGDSWLKGDKYFIMVNHANLNPDEWSFEPRDVPEDIFKKENPLILANKDPFYLKHAVVTHTYTKK